MRITRGWAPLFIAVLLSACGLELINVPANVEKPRAVVHVVLDPGRGQHLAVLTSTRVGAPSFVPGTPVNFDSIIGPPIVGARMVITGEDGDSAVAIPVTGVGARPGRYQFWNTAFAGGTPSAQIALVQGRRYRLRVETNLGTITGETKIPVVPDADLRSPDTLNVERDTLTTNATASGAAGYLVARGNDVVVIPELHAYLSVPFRVDMQGQRRERSTFDYLGGLTSPGSFERVAVAAADTNVVKFYISGFDPFGDDTKGNTVRGGVGLFGSSVMLFRQSLELVATIDLPIEGRWVTSAPFDWIPSELSLYDLRFRTDFGTNDILVQGPVLFRDQAGGTSFGVVRGDSIRIQTGFNTQDRAIDWRGSLRDGVLTLQRVNSTQTAIYRRP